MAREYDPRPNPGRPRPNPRRSGCLRSALVLPVLAYLTAHLTVLSRRTRGAQPQPRR